VAIVAIDTSALIAFVFGEPDGERYFTAMAQAERRVISSVNRYETMIVALAAKGDTGLAALERIMAELAIDSIAFDESQAFLALDAYRRFGRGFGAARLNFADCAAYALAKSLGVPLLVKGGDFAKTDFVAAALA
jgi:ribonuclease VapC